MSSSPRAVAANPAKDTPKADREVERDLLSDQSGATMVMGVFMAMMVVGMIYYVWGLGGTIIHRERMQDAADAAAFGASVFQARGMNIIALLNVVMAAVAIVGTAARLLADFIDATAGAADLACFLCCLGTLCIPCEEPCGYALIYDEEWIEWHGTLVDVADACDSIASGIHYAQVGVRTGAMVAAEGYVLTMLPNRYRPTVTEGLFVPGSLSISIQSEDDASEWACHHGNILQLGVRGPALVLVAAGEFALFSPPSEYWLAGEAYVAYEEFGTDSGDGSGHYCDEGSRTFQRVTDGHWLGDQNFQNYAAVFGTPPHRWVTSGVAVANWGRTEGTQPSVLGLDVSVATELHRISFADAEYYYEDEETDYLDGLSSGTRQEWLWHTRWRARMRRFHAGASITGMLGSVLSGVQSVIVH